MLSIGIRLGRRPIVNSSLAQRIKSAFAGIGPAGPSQLLWAKPGTDFMALSGSDVTQWHDLTDNAQHATDGTDRPVFVDPGGGADPYIEFTGANNDHFHIPYAVANGKDEWTIALSWNSAAAALSTIVQLYTGLAIKVYGNTLSVYYGGSTNGGVPGVVASTNHSGVMTYDGKITDATKRVRIFVDREERYFTTPPSWPATLPATHTAGIIGNTSTGSQDYTGRLHFLAQWYDDALDDTEIGALFDVLAGELAYASSWTPTGTSLTEHLNAAPVLGAELALTATGYTVTPGTPVTVYDKGSAHVGFTELETLGSGNLRCYWRNGKGHSDATGRIQYSASADNGATWSAVPTELVDTASIDDRDPTVGPVGGVATLFYVRYVSGIAQLYSMPVAGGTPENVFGYPFIPGTQKILSRGQAVDDGNLIVSYGGPPGASGWLATRVSGTDVYWTPPPDAGGGGVYRIFEPSAVRILLGDLLCVTRTGYPSVTTGPCMQLRSTDNGVTWGSAQLFPAMHGGQPLGIDCPRLFRMSTGVFIVVGRRRLATNVPLTLMYSTDVGATWSAPVDMLNLVDTDGGYCGVAELDSTHLLISYYCQSGGINRLVNVLPVTIEVTP